MQTLKQPYEMLVRWDQEGRLSGAHVQYRYVIKDGEKVVGESVSTAEPIAIGSDFPACDLMTQVQSDALAEVMRLQAEMSQREQTYQSAMAELDESHKATIRGLIAELDAARQALAVSEAG